MVVTGVKQLLHGTVRGLTTGVDYDWDYIEANATGSVHVYE
jgi:hypothetical protein